MQAPPSYSSRLRELGFVSSSESIGYIGVGEWRQSGQFFVARMVVDVAEGDKIKERSYWLKCPYDFWCNLDDVVRKRVDIARRLRSFGCNVPVTEWFEPATMIQEEVRGRTVETDRGAIPNYAREPIRREMELYELAGYRFMDGVSGNFIIDDQGKAWCIDLDLNKVGS